MNQLDRKKTAYHEAGHAVIGHLFGHRITSIKLLKGGRKRGVVVGGVCVTGGHTEWHRTHVRETRQVRPDIEPAIEIICLFAGMLAESKIELASEGEWSIQSDLTKIVELLDQIEGGEACLKPLILNCQGHVDRHWFQIEALAKALLADGRIVRATEIRSILGPRTVPLRKIISGAASALNGHKSAQRLAE
jgi:hypothetical protein